MAELAEQWINLFISAMLFATYNIALIQHLNILKLKLNNLCGIEGTDVWVHWEGCYAEGLCRGGPRLWMQWNDRQGLGGRRCHWETSWSRQLSWHLHTASWQEQPALLQSCTGCISLPQHSSFRDQWRSALVHSSWPWRQMTHLNRMNGPWTIYPLKVMIQIPK